MKTIFRLFLLSAIFLSCDSGGETENMAAKHDYINPDEAAIKKAVDDTYSAISFKNGQTPAFDSIQYSFIPQAQLINFIGDTAQILSIIDFVKAYKNYIQSDKIQIFREQEIYGRTDQFGNIAQRISSYKAYVNRYDIVRERGVNSFQLIKTPQGWRVSSIIWDIEKRNSTIPDYYLGKK